MLQKVKQDDWRIRIRENKSNNNNEGCPDVGRYVCPSGAPVAVAQQASNRH